VFMSFYGSGLTILQKFAELIYLYNGKKMHDKALGLLRQYVYISLEMSTATYAGLFSASAKERMTRAISLCRPYPTCRNLAPSTFSKYSNQPAGYLNGIGILRSK
jgi:Vacuolar sorting protein 39 domain 1